MKRNEFTELVLFSPIGDTDPIKGYNDGPCLHIIRKYHPKKVVLFLTEKMVTREKDYQYYSKPIKKVMPEIEIEEIDTNITEAHLHDSFLPILPDEVYRVHEENPEAKILINITSATPQMQSILAIISIQHDWAEAISVDNPDYRKGKTSPNNDPKIIDDIMECNLDDEEDYIDRCREPKLRILRYYDDKNKIESLIKQYEYDAAYRIAKNNYNIPDEVRNLLLHASNRMQLRIDEAKRCVARYNGVKLIPFEKDDGEVVEFFLTMQIEQRTDKLGFFLLKTTPFLYMFLQIYIEGNSKIRLADICENRKTQRRSNKKNDRQKRLVRSKMDKKMQDFFDKQILEKFNDDSGFKTTDLSPLNLGYICRYIDAEGLYLDKEKNDSMIMLLDKLDDSGFSKMRNDLAHIIINISEDNFKERTEGMSSSELLSIFFKMLCLQYTETTIIKTRKIYDQINEWIVESLSKDIASKNQLNI